MASADGIANGKGRRLDSWKAIALFLDRDVRSVQRWEHERGLPVYRLPGQKGGAVFAYERELEQWMRSRGSDAPPATAPDSVAAPARAPTAPFSVMRWGIVLGAVLFGIAAASALLLNKGSAPAPAPPQPPSIAVLPMQNFSGNPTQDYFADGFTEELVTELAQVRSLRVISRTSTMLYKGSRKTLPEIARELHATYILEGSVARDGARVRVTAQLIDARTDTHVAARTYDADLKDVLDIQSQLSRAIAEDVRLDLSPAEKTRLASARPVDPDAHDLYLRASYAFAQQTPSSIADSLSLYKAAAAKDPSFALAYVGIAQAEAALLQITAEGPEESVARQEAALTKALAINPHLGDARGLVAWQTYVHDRDWPRAEREFRIALAEGAQAPTEQRFGVGLDTRGRFEEGAAHLQTALELDPLGRSPRVNQFFGFYFQRKFADARRELDGLLKLSPDFLAGHALLGLVATMQHDCVIADLQAQWTVAYYPSPLADVEAAFANACRGDAAAARRRLEHAIAAKGHGFASPYQIALGYAAIHDSSGALAWLRKSADLKESQALYIKVDPMFDDIRADPQFVALEKRLRLEQ
jgi:TolB-like protein/Tfp pilus assembly protein PilF